jgi:hypothetical protein
MNAAVILSRIQFHFSFSISDEEEKREEGMRRRTLYRYDQATPN